MSRRVLFFIGLWCFLCLSCLGGDARAERIVLENGDVLTVDVVSQDENYIVVAHPVLGKLKIPRDKLRQEEKRIQEKEELPSGERPAEWKRRLTLGVDYRKGNVESGSNSMEVFLHRKRPKDEVTFKARAYYSQSHGEMDDRKYYCLGRYGFSFQEGGSWYAFGKLELEHDRFADVKFRGIPSFGVGYWFLSSDRFRLNLEGSLGWEYVDYYLQDSDDNVLAVGSLRWEYRPSVGWEVFEDVDVYPSFDEGSYRLRSETGLRIRLKEQMTLKLSLLEEYDSDPAEGKKKSDLRFISGLEWEF